LISKEYDTPHLLSEKETLIQLLKKDKTQFYWGIATLVLLVILISLFGFYQHILKKRYKSRFEKIMNRENAPSNIVITPIPEAIVIATKNKEETDIGIAEELVSQILDKLNEFENENGYLESKLTIQMLSTAFDTNSKYVSKIINTFKGKTFIQYINDLRIEYAIIHLKKDTKLTNFTIQALAQEFGFNSAESFSNAFYKKTGIKPTYFIKKLVGFTETQNNN
jgi:AraC-like DNA-binding protein